MSFARCLYDATPTIIVNTLEPALVCSFGAASQSCPLPRLPARPCGLPSHVCKCKCTNACVYTAPQAIGNIACTTPRDARAVRPDPTRRLATAPEQRSTDIQLEIYSAETQTDLYVNPLLLYINTHRANSYFRTFSPLFSTFVQLFHVAV